MLGNNGAFNYLREIKENSTGCQAYAGPRIRISEGNSKVCKQNYGYGARHPISPIALQSSPTIDELCLCPELHPGGNIHQIRDTSITDPSQQVGLGVVDRPQKGPPMHSDASNKGWGAVLNG